MAQRSCFLGADQKERSLWERDCGTPQCIAIQDGRQITVNVQLERGGLLGVLSHRGRRQKFFLWNQRHVRLAAFSLSLYFSVMHLPSASPRGGGGGPRADVETLLIVHFKVLVFPHRRGIFFWQSPQYLAKPNTQQDEKTHFRTSVWFFEQLAPDIIMIKTWAHPRCKNLSPS